ETNDGGAAQSPRVVLVGRRRPPEGFELRREAPGDPGAEALLELAGDDLFVDQAEWTADAVENVVVGLASERIDYLQEAFDRRASGANERPLIADQRESLDGRQDILQARDECTLIARLVQHPIKAAG